MRRKRQGNGFQALRSEKRKRLGRVPKPLEVRRKRQGGCFQALRSEKETPRKRFQALRSEKENARRRASRP